MPKVIRVREVTPEEKRQLEKMTRSRRLAGPVIQRARLIMTMLNNPKMPAGKAGKQVGYKSEAIGPEWVKRFNAEGIEGLKDRERSGRPPTHTEDVRSKLVSLAQQKPHTLGYPFVLWTLERLQRAFKEREGVHLSDSTIWEWLDDEGLKWKHQQTWFHDAAQHDPEFEEKRGPSSNFTSTHPSEPA